MIFIIIIILSLSLAQHRVRYLLRFYSTQNLQGRGEVLYIENNLKNLHNLLLNQTYKLVSLVLYMLCSFGVSIDDDDDDARILLSLTTTQKTK